VRGALARVATGKLSHGCGNLHLVWPPVLPDHLNGRRLYGDDFDQPTIDRWFADEADACVDLAGTASYEFEESQWFSRYGYRFLPRRRWRHVLGFGAAEGRELVPCSADFERITILESSSAYHPAPELRCPSKMQMAQPSGDIALAEGSVDLVVCQGALHHIPNVSHIISELGRICESGGWAIIREPIVSMGDWTRPRPNLSPHERGIPLGVLRRMLVSAGFVIRNERLLGFPPIRLLRGMPGVGAPYNSPVWATVDAALCRAVQARVRYHATKRINKLRPTSASLIAERL
jgi:SAM-dependent methyltransferase